MATFRDMLSYFRPYWPLGIASIAASSVFELIDLLIPYATGQILNILSQQPTDAIVRGLVAIAAPLGLENSPNAELIVLLGLTFMVTVLRAPLQPWISTWFHWDIPLRSRRDQAARVMEKILTLPLEFYDENNPGRIAGRVAKGLSNHTWTYPEVAGQLVPKLVRIAGIFAVIWWIEWRIALLFLVSFTLILGFTVAHLRRLITKETLLDHHIENTESRMAEVVTNIKTVKAFATEQRELTHQQQRLQREFKMVNYRIHRGYVVLFTWQRTFVQSCVFAILMLTLVAALNNQISLGYFVTTLTISSMAYSELEPISVVVEVFARRYASMLRFHELMAEPVGEDAASLNDPAAVPQYQFTGKLEFSRLTFGYAQERPVLKGIDLLIEPYQTVALVGRSGSGKSTLVKLLFRYFNPNQGGIRIDGQDIRTLDITGYRRRLAIVHQEVDVFNGTLLENLTYGRPEASLEDVEEACRVARVDDFIHRLPRGYGTMVGERGVRLSGGQRQRLGIARALLVNPDVLVFDEATSSLDYESERAIQLAMGSILATRQEAPRSTRQGVRRDESRASRSAPAK